MTVAASTIEIIEDHTSVVLGRLIDEAPADDFTLGWIIGHLPRRCYGVMLLFLAIVALLPIISIPARLLILVLMVQGMLGYPAPILPGRWMKRKLPARHLQSLKRNVIPALQRLETVVRPRWCPIFDKTRRFAAVLVFFLTLVSLLAPVPFANVPPALICILIALGYIEHDGFILAAGYVSAFVLLGAVSFLLYQT